MARIWEKKKEEEMKMKKKKKKKYGVQWQDVGMISGRKWGRPWPGYGPKSYGKKKKKRTT